MVVDTQPQEKKLPVHKSIYLLPNLITSLSMFMGFLSMVWAVQSRFEEAGLAIVLSALLDGMDGKVARLTHTASEFGVQYDSLADLIAFGLAPAFLLWQWQLESLGRFGVGQHRQRRVASAHDGTRKVPHPVIFREARVRHDGGGQARSYGAGRRDR